MGNETVTRTEIVTPPPGYQQGPATTTTLVSGPSQTGTVPAGITHEMIDFFDRRTDAKIQATVSTLNIRTLAEAEADYRRDMRQKLLIGGVAFVGGIAVAAAFRRWQDSRDDGDDDMGDEDGGR